VSELTPGRPDQAIADVLAGGAPSRIRVSVDLSRGFSTNRVTASFDDCDRPLPEIGDLVDAVDLATHQEAPAEVVGINEEHRTVALTIDWDRLREVSA